MERSQGHSFERIDWLSFLTTTALMQAVYLATINPDIGLRNDGVSATAAMYGGVSMPCGFPVWTIWAWAWAKAPLGTVGWRISFATALAASLTCGVVALMVSRAGAALVEDTADASWLRASAGVSAGAVFGLSGGFWRQAVVPDPWPMSVLLVALILCLLTRWSGEPERRVFLYLAALTCGVTIAESRIAEALLPAVPFALALRDEKLGRDTFAAGVILYLLAWCAGSADIQSAVAGSRPYLHFFGWIAILLTIALSLKTRRIFTHWKPVVLCALLFVLGFSISFEASLVSMSNPPVNWGYPRTPEGFFHVITRGQYDKALMAPTLLTLWADLCQYALTALSDFGWPCLLLAAAPFLSWRWLDPTDRRRLLALTAVFLCLSVLLVATVDPTPDRTTSSLVKLYFTPSYFVLALFLGHGLLLAHRVLTRARQRTGNTV